MIEIGLMPQMYVCGCHSSSGCEKVQSCIGTAVSKYIKRPGSVSTRPGVAGLNGIRD